MKDKTILIYRSRTGFTKGYAEMIAKETGCDLAELQNVKAESLTHYHTIIFGSRLHAGQIDGLSKAKAIFQQSGAKRFILFAVGAMPNTAEETIAEMWKNNLSAEETERIPHFYMQGGLSYERMGFIDKTMMKAAAVIMSRRSNDEVFKKMISQSYDISSEEYIKPLTNLLKDD